MSFSHTEAWLEMIRDVSYVPEFVYPRGLASKQVTFVKYSVLNPLSFPMQVEGREMRDVIGVLEGLSLVGEFSIPELFTDKVRKFADFMDGGIMWGAYGARTHGQLGGIAELLEKDLDSRQAVMTFYDAKRDLDRGKKDVPCTIAGQFIVRATDTDRDVLDLCITMRSNDLWLGTPYDLVQFSILQASLAQALNIDVGHYTHQVGSLHLYARDEEKVKDLKFKGGPSMKFPLWNSIHLDHVQGAGRRLAVIQSRARRLALGQLEPVTEFEAWCDRELRS